MASTHECIFCKQPTAHKPSEDLFVNVGCKLCGDYKIEAAAKCQVSKEMDPLICAWVRSKSDRGDPARIGINDIGAIKKSLIPKGVAEKLRLLLKWVASKSIYPGFNVLINPQLDWPVAWCSNADELTYHFEALVAQGLLAKQARNTNGLPANITPSGWQSLEIARGEEVEEDLVFVAMWFDNQMDNAWLNGFQTGINAANYRAHRADKIPHTERIDMKVLGDIRRSRIVVADATGARPNVYYEAGYAEALGRPVIWTVQKERKKDMQFDTRQFPHILWSDPGDLAKNLEEFIAGLIGRRKKP